MLFYILPRHVIRKFPYLTACRNRTRHFRDGAELQLDPPMARHVQKIAECESNPDLHVNGAAKPLTHALCANAVISTCARVR
jgi:hypothetical protein